MIKKLSLIALFCLLFVMQSFAQREYNALGNDRPAWVDKIYVGGGLGGFGISDNQVWVNVSGQVGYRITEKWNAGVGITYQYFKYKRPIEQSFNDYGVNFFTQYVVYQPFFVMARYEIFFLDQIDSRATYDTFLLGGGITQPMGGKGFLNFYALYNVLYSDGGDNGRYDSPWVIGMNIGIGF
ncbi:hypothetical protein N7E81_11180 [Reichenbachiella carrageenanivorans]|uniref:Outer membrane protein beta-barrel domain-containing protein n=1 Tax=Reichenbachiella carrageenanivorans TaxID=2979869 RepID=A0ABY6CYS0_9BACT|nr:hypothetical protein [Reichenbachiella carrageenanivorans]UXX77928.1 hypothetical protein N7E81_11180 [Reichenbachiella carrageenanivorans]